MLKMVETTTKYPGKLRTCLQKVCMAVYHPKKTFLTDFVHFCPFLPVLGRFGAEFGHVAPKCPKSRFEKGTSAIENFS